MSDEDLLMGMRGSTRVWAAYRIDYDSTEDVRFDQDRNARTTNAAKCPPSDHPKHSVKSGHQRKVIVEDAATRDDVTNYLDNQGIAYTVEDVTPTQSQKAAIKNFGTAHGVDGKAAIEREEAIANASTVAELKEVVRGKDPKSGKPIDRPNNGKPFR